jgi:hypothetical protein
MRALKINRITAITDINIHSAVFELTWLGTGAWTKAQNTDKDMDKATDADTDIDLDIEFVILAKYLNSAIVPIAPYVVPLTYYGAISNGAICS